MREKITQQLVRSLKPKDSQYDVYDTELDGFVARVQKSGTISFLLSYKNAAGQSRNYTIGKNGRDGLNATLARERAERLKHEVKNGGDPHVDRRRNRQAERTNLEATLEAYFTGPYELKHLSKRKPRGAEGARASLNGHFGHLMSKPMSAITHQDIECWQSDMTSRGRTQETIRRVRSELESLLNKAVKDNWIAENPLAGLERIKADTYDDPITRFLSPEEHSRLIQALRDRDSKMRQKAQSGHQWREERGYPRLPVKIGKYYVDHLEPMVLLSLHTGVRQNELFTLDWSDILDDEINLRPENTKSGKRRILPLNTTSLDVLRKWKLQTSNFGLVFSNNGKKFDNVDTSWRNLCKKANITDFRWHDMRHDFASKLISRGASPNTIRELLGHGSMRMTQRYAHLSNNVKSEAVALLD